MLIWLRYLFISLGMTLNNSLFKLQYFNFKTLSNTLPVQVGKGLAKDVRARILALLQWLSWFNSFGSALIVGYIIF
jgi:hypothetical protein